MGDLVMFIPFNALAKVEFAAQSVAHADALAKHMMKTLPSSGTSFNNALQQLMNAVDKVCLHLCT